ncbi:uracil DNA glycosylase [Serpentinimonas maccroryi]|uniref:Uracil-DNA glycosylase n=1 Tax=Serpentinimonas maccroryi TaxID=1458426 RepID=A0A060NXM3_9BURK|nr:uracil-DNA glycosylase [Serpentinimonas maccroryi]BAO84278.1 uracil DNA glycosylase [Serpentinimonas maccroryi]
MSALGSANSAQPQGSLSAWAPQDWSLAPDWQPLWQAFLASPHGQQLGQRLQEQIDAGLQLYPAHPLRALALTPLEQVRVVILGQDPYHGPGQAEGLAFSVPAGQRPPPSLRNIWVELKREAACCQPADQPVHQGSPQLGSSLEPWARQGVLLLNTTLTVQAGLAGSHAGWGWERFTHAVLQACAAHGRPKAFLLWGRHAQATAESAALDRQPHLCLRANHPSPLAARRPPQPFIGCGHFGAVNRWLLQRGEKSIDWC